MYFKKIKMKKNERFCDHAKGFTLLEVIVTLTVAAILGTILVMFMGKSVLSSVFPVTRVQQEYTLNQTMENINSDYRKLLLEAADPLGTLQSRINTAYYGTTFSVDDNDFITFTTSGTSRNEVSSPGDRRILKVSLSSGDHTLTTLFTK